MCNISIPNELNPRNTAAKGPVTALTAVAIRGLRAELEAGDLHFRGHGSRTERTEKCLGVFVGRCWEFFFSGFEGIIKFTIRDWV